MAEAIALEKDFINDCLPMDSIGLRKEDFLQYIDYIADRRLEGVGLDPLIGNVQNPLPWLACGPLPAFSTLTRLLAEPWVL